MQGATEKVFAALDESHWWKEEAPMRNYTTRDTTKFIREYKRFVSGVKDKYDEENNIKKIEKQHA